MRADLPPAIVAALARCDRPTLVFDRARIERNLRGLAEAARASGVTALFAAKSFPDRDVRALAAELLDGFDVASEGELAELPAARVLSIADPTGRAAAATESHRGRLIVACESVAQAEAAPARAELAIRVSASITGRDPAVGAIQEGSGRRRSRFGIEADEPAQLAAIAAAARGRPVGLHVHHGPVSATTATRFVETAQAALAFAAAAGVTPRFLDLGGAWHAVPDLSAAIAQVRAAVPADIEVILEPGRLISEEAGFACGRVVVARELADRALRVIDLSRICHLRWSQLELVGAAPHPGTGRTALVVGPTCSEDDVLGEWTIPPHALAAGSQIVVRHVTGYAAAWNASFGGVPPAALAIV